VVVHEASGLNDNIRDICGRFAAEGYDALGVDLFEGRNRAVCMARMNVLVRTGVRGRAVPRHAVADLQRRVDQRARTCGFGGQVVSTCRRVPA
jgi:dienelactone hydrolase